MQLQMYSENILNIQKKITVYKALNGQDVEDINIARYLLQLGTVYRALKKYDDALRSYKESEKIIKRIAPTNPEAKLEEAPIKKVIEETLKEKAKNEGKDGKQVQPRALPNSNYKIAMYATVCVAAAGLIAYAVMKKRQ